jgi:hypothetical protein
LRKSEVRLSQKYHHARRSIKVTIDQPARTELSRNQKLAMGAATICFLIGWFHTGQGLANYRVLGTEYGGFVLATGVLCIMILAYNKAIKGSLVGLGFYLLCAIITFICNLNSFYPNYRANALIREELREHRTNLGELRESIKSEFQDVQLNALAESVRSKSKQLQAQCRQRGFGPLTEEVLKSIEAELGRRITRLRLGTNQAEWDSCAERYEVIIEDELMAKLKENRYSEKLEDIRHAEEYYVLYSQKIDDTLADRTELKRVPDYVEGLVKGYRDSCKKATSLIASERKEQTAPASASNELPLCDQAYASPNVEMGTFSHTFKSIWATRGDGGTWTVILIALFIDFLMPLALYLLVRTESNSARSEDFWTAGGKKVGPTIRS